MSQLKNDWVKTELTTAQQQAVFIAKGVREPVLMLNGSLEIITANEKFLTVFGLKNKMISGVPVLSLNDHGWELSELDQLLNSLLLTKQQIQDAAVVFELPSYGKIKCLVNASLLEFDGESVVMLNFKPELETAESLLDDDVYKNSVREVLMNAPALMCSLKGPDHVFEYANEGYYSLIGKRGIIGKSVREVLPEVEGQGFFETLDEVYRTGEPYIGRDVPITLHPEGKEAKEVCLDFIYQPIRNADGVINGIFVMAVDVTEKVAARKKIEESENELRNIMDTAPVIIWISDEKNQNVYLNRKWYEYTGQTREASKDQGWIEALHPEDRKAARKLFYQAMQENKSHEVFFRLGTSEGNYRWMINQGSPRLDKEGNFCGMVGAVVDVHEEVMNGQLVREKEHRTRTIVEEATVATAVYIGREMTIEFANDSMIGLWGKDRSVVGKTLREALPELEGQPFFQLLDEVYTTGNTYHGKEDKVDLMIDGKMQTGYFNFSYKPLQDKNGEIYGILNMAMDVTDQRQARMEIEESERRYQEIIHSSPALIATFEGEDMEIKIANDSILEAWGKGKEVMGKPLFSVMPELEEQGFKEMLRGVYETGKPYRAYEMPVTLIRNGQEEEMFFNFVYYPQRDLDGKITGIVDIATEVTPQAILNKKIKESESHFRQMADLMPEKVINTDKKGTVIYFNQHWLNYTGLSSDELKKKDWTQLIHPEDKAGYQQSWEQSLNSGENLDMEIRILNKEGDYKWHLSRAEAVKDRKGKIKLWIATNTDIQRLKEEEKRKEDFLKMVSHELKTPVTSIKGYVQLLLSLSKSAQEKKVSSLPVQPSLERIDHQITRLTRLISEILDLSRIEENKLKLRKEIFSMNELVNQTVQDINYTKTQHQIEVVHDCECMVDGDMDRIGQVLINLITNAIKYSPENLKVKVTVHQKTEGKVTVTVRDFGIGIDKENHNHIFKRFYRITEEKEDTYSGFGIGLFLANEIIQRHQGYIEVNSKKGEGSEFSFTLSEVPGNDNA